MNGLTRGPSKNLTWEELACKDGTPYPDKYIKDGRVFELARVFEDIRAIWNKPITIHSVYRTEEHNKAIGGAPNSQHVLGNAMDLAPPKGIRLDDFYINIKRRCKEFGIGGIGKYKTFVHVDIRSTPKLKVWTGTGTKDSLS